VPVSNADDSTVDSASSDPGMLIVWCLLPTRTSSEEQQTSNEMGNGSLAEVNSY
jgi:hypothetical protein